MDWFPTTREYEFQGKLWEADLIVYFSKDLQLDITVLGAGEVTDDGERTSTVEECKAIQRALVDDGEMLASLVAETMDQEVDA